MKILNLYAGIGGNRKLWGDEHDITAVEWDEETANVYQDYFPNDEVIVANAHKYLLNNMDNFDFVWSSPPCPSHSILNRTNVGIDRDRLKYPDMKLYEEIILLDKWFGGKYVVENVIPYYEPLIPAEKVHRHLFWSNFRIGKYEVKNNKKPHEQASEGYLEDFLGYDLSDYNLENKRKNLRNCVLPEVGKYILDRAQNIVSKSNTKQTALSL